jgi:hypothetical protein
MLTTGPLVQMVILVVMTHGFRVLGRSLGPRRGGLLMGLPSTSAVLLLSCAVERGVGEASVAAEAALAGLAAAVILPLAYARAARAGCRLPAATAAGVLGYGAVAGLLWWLPGLGGVACASGAAAGVAAACRLARRLRSAGAEKPPAARRRSAGWVLASRTLVPMLFVVSVHLLGEVAGPTGTGRLLTFPGMSLAVLVATHAEAGGETACRLAAAMPAGNLGTLGFLTVFRFASPCLGLGWGTAGGYATALALLASAGAFGGSPAAPPPVTRQRKRLRADRASPARRSRSHRGRHANPAREARRRRRSANRNPRSTGRRRRRRLSSRVEALTR